MVDLIDTNGVKPTLKKGVLGYDDYNAGGDAGRLYVGTGTASIAQAKKSEVDLKANISNPAFSANIGIGGTTPSTWSSLNVMEGSGGTFFGTNGTSSLTGSNANYNGSWTYKGAGSAGLQLVNQGSHQFRVAPTGTAGGAITWETVADLNTTGLNVKSGTASLPGFGFLGDTDTGIYNPAANTVGIATNGTEKVRIDSAGNVGIGVTPSAWGSSVKALDFQLASVVNFGNSTELWHNAYYNGTTSVYKTNNYASSYKQGSGIHTWQTAPSGTAGNAISWTNAMTLDANGNLTVRSTSGYHSFRNARTTNAGNMLMEIAESGTGSSAVEFYSVSVGASGTGLNSAAKFGKDAITSRSISLAGSLSQNGADYAEYEYSNDINIIKGQIVGFKADGTLTDKYSESIRFAIKSTNPGIVGGDTWGSEEIVGKRPEQPIKTEEMTDEEFTALEEQYKLDLADFESRLEVERQKVDRIAYAGKVPVNVLGATAGDYIIVVDRDDKIDGEAISDPTFEQYLKCVGRVNKILEDGRAEVAVIIH